jgi:holo-[acyl-carrier-protein] synthase
MILGLGIDAVDIRRMQRWIENPGLVTRFFHPREIADAQGKGTEAAYSLAARFAAKEAYGKAMGTGLRGMTLKNILVTNNTNGKPELILFGDALVLFKRIDGRRIHISLTHERTIAIANVILEG